MVSCEKIREPGRLQVGVGDLSDGCPGNIPDLLDGATGKHAKPGLFILAHVLLIYDVAITGEWNLVDFVYAKRLVIKHSSIPFS